MKLLIPIALLLLFSSCNQEELKRSNYEKDSLMNLLSEREASLNEFISYFNDVEQNLDSVTSRQQIISVSTKGKAELSQSQREHINSEILSINLLMEENRKKLDDLSAKLKKSKSRNIQMEKTIATLKNQLIHKFLELSSLNDMLSLQKEEIQQLKTSVDTLTFRNTLQTEAIASEKARSHTAYYIVSSAKALREAKLIDKKGGILGIGSTTNLNEDFDKNKFTRIDIMQTTSIKIYSKSIKIISSHPSDSYVLEREEKIIKRLVITNPEKFWSISKYLVISRG